MNRFVYVFFISLFMFYSCGKSNKRMVDNVKKENIQLKEYVLGKYYQVETYRSFFGYDEAEVLRLIFRFDKDSVIIFDTSKKNRIGSAKYEINNSTFTLYSIFTNTGFHCTRYGIDKLDVDMFVASASSDKRVNYFISFEKIY